MRLRTSILVALAMFALDQWTKSLVVARFRLGESLPVVPGFFSLTYVRNRGGAFGMLSDAPGAYGRIFLSVFAVATMGVLGWMLRETPREDRMQRWALTAVIAGAAGNLVDRLRSGEVVDFLDVYVRDWHWPAFNVADSFITCGVILLVLVTLAGGESEKTSE